MTLSCADIYDRRNRHERKLTGFLFVETSSAVPKAVNLKSGNKYQTLRCPWMINATLRIQ
jgi:hypothetical protein